MGGGVPGLGFIWARSMGASAMISADEIEAINRDLRDLSRTDPAIKYGLVDEPANLRALQKIVELIPKARPTQQAAWLLRAIILVQPFPDGNHRTALVAAELLLKRSGIRFEPSVEAASKFQRDISGARFRLLGGYDDAPLSILERGGDPVLELCASFVEHHASTKGAKD